MRSSLRDLLQNLEKKMDSATNRLDKLGRKLGHGLETISDHIDEKINQQEQNLLDRFEKLDDNSDDPVV